MKFMKPLLLTLIALCTFTFTGFAGWSWVTINGQTYSVCASADGRWQTLDGPGGFHAEGYR